MCTVSSMTSDAQRSDPAGPAQYGRGAATLHWVSAILIIAMLVQGFFMTKLEDGDSKTLLYQLHVTLGYLVLILSVIRVIWAMRDRRPDPPEMPGSEYLAYKGIHVLLVLGSVVTAISGILLLLGSDITPIAPAVAPGDVDRSLPIRNAHFVFAIGMLILLVAHVGGVVMYQRRVGRTLSRMRWPGSGKG